MAYSEKYFHSYCNSLGFYCRVSISEQDYVGTTTEVEAQETPFEKEYENSSDFKFEPIRASKGKCNLVFGNGIDFEELWTADERQFKVEHYIDGILDWVGFVIPNGFSYDFTGGLYYAEVEASDGLATLADIAFIDQSIDDTYGIRDLTYNEGFLFPWSLIATEILRKLELDLDLWTCVDVYERTMLKTGDTRDADPLSSSFANVKTYINKSDRKDIPYWSDEGSAMNCLQVLENLCYVFGAKVYQSQGVWRIKRINADADYGTGATQRYWRKYNTLNVYLGQEPINEDITIPCATIEKAMIGSHTMQMGDVYGAFRMNYEFALLQDGDTPLSLIKNGDFSVYNNDSKLAAPEHWFRWRAPYQWHLGMRPQNEATPLGISSTTVEIGRQDPSQSQSNIDRVAHSWNSLRYGETINVTEGDLLYLNFALKQATMAYIPGHGISYLGFAFRIMLLTDTGENYFLRNDPENEQGKQYLTWVEGDGYDETRNIKLVYVLYNAILMLGESMEADVDDATSFQWRKYSSRIAPAPKSGQIIFDIHGVLSGEGEASLNFPKLEQYLIPHHDPEKTGPRMVYTLRDGRYQPHGGPVPYPLITDIDLGRIPDPNQFAEKSDYKYENPNPNYTLEVEPIEVMNGDTPDEQHVSRIVVPSNPTGKNFWDTLGDKYGLSSLGLITVKSIMNLYIHPFRLLEGTIKAPGATYDTRFEFEALPGKKFMLLRGNFNEKRNYIENATFFEISDIAIPQGGTEGNNSLQPDYSPTGLNRCAKDVDGLNTGVVEIQERDMNPNSPTYNQTTWTGYLTNPVTCPIGEPTQYYWGTDDVSLEVANLESLGYTEGANSVKCTFSNPGGEYIYFLHIDSKGVVEKVTTEPQVQIVSDFQYLADVEIEGYTFRVLRQDYPTAQFDDFDITFTFS